MARGVARNDGTRAQTKPAQPRSSKVISHVATGFAELPVNELVRAISHEHVRCARGEVDRDTSKQTRRALLKEINRRLDVSGIPA